MNTREKQVAKHIAEMLDMDEYNQGQLEAVEEKARNAARLLGAVTAKLIEQESMSIQDVDDAVYIWPGLEDRLNEDNA